MTRCSRAPLCSSRRARPRRPRGRTVRVAGRWPARRATPRCSGRWMPGTSGPSAARRASGASRSPTRPAASSGASPRTSRSSPPRPSSSSRPALPGAPLGGDARLATRVVGTGMVEPTTGQWIGTWALEMNGDLSLERATRQGPAAGRPRAAARRPRDPAPAGSPRGPERRRPRRRHLPVRLGLAPSGPALRPADRRHHAARKRRGLHGAARRQGRRPPGHRRRVSARRRPADHQSRQDRRGPPLVAAPLLDRQRRLGALGQHRAVVAHPAPQLGGQQPRGGAPRRLGGRAPRRRHPVGPVVRPLLRHGARQHGGAGPGGIAHARLARVRGQHPEPQHRRRAAAPLGGRRHQRRREADGPHPRGHRRDHRRAPRGRQRALQRRPDRAGGVHLLPEPVPDDAGGEELPSPAPGQRPGHARPARRHAGARRGPRQDRHARQREHAGGLPGPAGGRAGGDADVQRRVVPHGAPGTVAALPDPGRRRGADPGRRIARCRAGPARRRGRSAAPDAARARARKN